MPLSETDLKKLQFILHLSEDDNSFPTTCQLVKTTVKSSLVDRDGRISKRQYDFNVGEQKESFERDSSYNRQGMPEKETSCDSYLQTDVETDTEADFESDERFDTHSDVLDELYDVNKESQIVAQDKENTEPMDYAGVFHDVKSVILSFLNQRDVARTCRVCREWRENSEYIQCIQSSNTIGLDILKENVSKVPRLLSLDLWCIWLGDAGSRELADLLKEHKLVDLQRIKLFIMASDIRASGTKYLLEELRKGVCPNLLTLDLNQNSFGDNEVQTLGEVLKSIENQMKIEENIQNCHKERIDYRLSRRSYSDSYSSELGKTHFLSFLYEKKNTLYEKDMRRNSNGFDTLNLRQNRISEEGLLKFANQLMELGIPILRTIDLRKNKVDKDAVARLAQRFPAIQFKV